MSQHKARQSLQGYLQELPEEYKNTKHKIFELFKSLKQPQERLVVVKDDGDIREAQRLRAEAQRVRDDAKRLREQMEQKREETKPSVFCAGQERVMYLAGIANGMFHSITPAHSQEHVIALFNLLAEDCMRHWPHCEELPGVWWANQVAKLANAHPDTLAAKMVMPKIEDHLDIKYRMQNAMIERSQMAWREGGRSGPSVRANLPKLVEGFGSNLLVSTYAGGECVVITNPYGMHFREISEIPEPEQTWLVGSHHQKAAPFIAKL